MTSMSEENIYLFFFCKFKIYVNLAEYAKICIQRIKPAFIKKKIIKIEKKVNKRLTTFCVQIKKNFILNKIFLFY